MSCGNHATSGGAHVKPGRRGGEQEHGARAWSSSSPRRGEKLTATVEVETRRDQQARQWQGGERYSVVAKPCTAHVSGSAGRGRRAKHQARVRKPGDQLHHPQACPPLAMGVAADSDGKTTSARACTWAAPPPKAPPPASSPLTVTAATVQVQPPLYHNTPKPKPAADSNIHPSCIYMACYPPMFFSRSNWLRL